MYVYIVHLYCTLYVCFLPVPILNIPNVLFLIYIKCWFVTSTEVTMLVTSVT